MTDSNTLSTAPFGWIKLILFYIISNNFLIDTKSKSILHSEETVLPGIIIPDISIYNRQFLSYHLCPW